MSGRYDDVGNERPRTVRDHTAVWDRLRPITDPKVRPEVEPFCASRRITVEALAELGTRAKRHHSFGWCLAYAGMNGDGVVTAIKYRPINGSSHDSFAEKPSVWLQPILVGKRSSLTWLAVEGETDAARLFGLVGDRCAILVLPAGAKTFRPEWAAMIPRGATVALCHDADEDGDAGADLAAKILGGQTVRVRPPVEGGDWCDWSGSAEEFAKLARPQPAAATRRIVDMREAMRDAMAPLPFRVGPLAIDGYVTMLVGRRGEHKSWLAQFACHAVQRDEPVGPLGQRAGRALYLDAEGGARLMGRRLIVAGMDHNSFTYADGLGLHLPADIAHVRELVDYTQANLLVLDSLRRLAPTMKENDSDSIAPLMEAIAGVARDTSCAIMAIAHRSTKPGAPDVRGSSALEDQVDVVWQLEKVKGDPERRTRRRLRNTKMRPDEELPAVWLRFHKLGGFMKVDEALPFVSLDDVDGDDDPSERAPELMAERIRMLAELVDKDGGWPPARVAQAIGADRKSSTFQRALKLLLDSGEWAAEGATRNRRVRPADLRHSSDPLRDGANGANGEPLFDPDDSGRDAAHQEGR